MRKLKLTSGTKINVLVKRVDFEQDILNELRKRSHALRLAVQIKCPESK